MKGPAWVRTARRAQVGDLRFKFHKPGQPPSTLLCNTNTRSRDISQSFDTEIKVHLDWELEAR
jgi:hypothetical protein